MEIFFSNKIIQVKIISCKGEIHFEEEEEKKPDNALLHLTSKIKVYKIVFEHWFFGCLIPDIFSCFYFICLLYPVSNLSSSSKELSKG